MDQDDWLKNLEQRNKNISKNESTIMDRSELIDNFIQICRQKRDTLLEYHIFLNHIEDLNRKNQQPTEEDIKTMQDKVYMANKNFIQGLDSLDGTNCWENMRKMMDDSDENTI